MPEPPEQSGVRHRPFCCPKERPVLPTAADCPPAGRWLSPRRTRSPPPVPHRRPASPADAPTPAARCPSLRPCALLPPCSTTLQPLPTYRRDKLGYRKCRSRLPGHLANGIIGRHACVSMGGAGMRLQQQNTRYYRDQPTGKTSSDGSTRCTGRQLSPAAACAARRHQRRGGRHSPPAGGCPPW